MYRGKQKKKLKRVQSETLKKITKYIKKCVCPNTFLHMHFKILDILHVNFEIEV